MQFLGLHESEFRLRPRVGRLVEDLRPVQVKDAAVSHLGIEEAHSVSRVLHPGLRVHLDGARDRVQQLLLERRLAGALRLERRLRGTVPRFIPFEVLEVVVLLLHELLELLYLELRVLQLVQNALLVHRFARYRPRTPVFCSVRALFRVLSRVAGGGEAC